MDANRKTAYYALMDVETKSSYSNLALNHQIILGKPSSPSFVRGLVYGVLENKILLDHIIEHFITSDIDKLKTSDLVILRMGIYQLGYMNSVPEYAAVNESVVLAKKFCKGREGFINGVLRSYIRNRHAVPMPDRSEDQIKYLSIKYSCLEWIVEMWIDQYGVETTEQILKYSQGNPGLCIRVNTLKTGKEDLMRRLTEKGFEVKESQICDSALLVTKGNRLLEDSLYKSGLFSVQDESSMKTVEMMDPKPGEMVVDVCAAPGGKTLAAAERMSNRGQIIATDIYLRKLTLINKEADRLGVSIVKTWPWDATKVDSELLEKADRVLADVPCSGLGVIRRKPEIKYKKRLNEFDSLPIKQLEILKVASKYVKRGGILQYSTCTINKQENEEVIKEFLKKNKSFSIVEERQFMPHIDRTDGFYVCKMVRSDSLI
ncbi:16S rRNA (cytosine(967)-C(5))-methyltransferase RsmB [Aminipila luticellarii]|uniref:16S rRNA (cytosine(967)-C(5))-methyltransferase n=1 Tax=Aminipila luticellarii TaxID=2507160 RepID=A0A410PW81_9FIRM|nr:16S rRNA (cytosine(967)-C(5))-methyltransferase RsmB [Aminipila luticellarii]QAT43191.1 16S rRNA (cytosine(967)-C(5))-methyltransferase RsmB [Aminipila luticellarii]